MAPAPTPQVSTTLPPVVSQERGSDFIRSRFVISESKAGNAGNTRKALLSYDELPKWHQDNEYIRHGYRPISGSARASFNSWSYIHNESVNIYSHLIPAILFLLSARYIQDYLTRKYPMITCADFFIFTSFLFAAAICLGLSATYHTLMNHSHEVDQLWLRLDLVGIVIMTMGDFLSGIYMAFWCEPFQRNIYWSVSGILGLVTILIMISPKFQGQKFRLFRALTFVITGLSGFAPMTHGLMVFGVSKMMKQSGMPYYLIEAGFLLLGALVYATKFPESRFPGTFDIYGSSHQLFHILVVFAAVTQLTGILAAFDYNYTNRTCIPQSHA